MSSVQLSHWEGEWHSQLIEAVRAEGAQSVTEFLSRYPCEPYTKVVRHLSDRFAAIQIEVTQFEEASRANRLRDAARDCFTRLICDHLKRGWGRGRHVEFNTAGVYADWLSDLEFRAGRPELCTTGQAVWKALLQQNPPEGWLPTGPEDPLIVAAFDAGWPTSAVIEPLPVGPHVFCPKCSEVLIEPKETDLDQQCPLCRTKYPLP